MRGLSIADGTSVLLKFPSLLEVEKLFSSGILEDKDTH